MEERGAEIGSSRWSSLKGRKISLAGAATSIIFVATKTCLSRQNTSFVATKVCLSRQNFCRHKHVFVATYSRQFFLYTFVGTKDAFVATKLLSRQKLYLWQLPPMIEKGPSSIERTLELFQRQRWGNFWDGVEHIIMGFSQRMDTMNWTEPDPNTWKVQKNAYILWHRHTFDVSGSCFRTLAVFLVSDLWTEQN